MKGIHEGSVMSKLSGLKVGEAYYFECPNVDELRAIHRKVSAATRYPKPMRNWRFSGEACTAIATRELGVVRLLLRVERIE